MPKSGSPVNKNHSGHTALQACTPEGLLLLYPPPSLCPWTKSQGFRE